MRGIVVVALVVLAACGGGRWVEAQRIKGPDGTRNWLLVRCRIYTDCIEHASKACRFGYDITNEYKEGRASGDMLVHCLPRGAPPTVKASPRADESEAGAQ